MSMTNAELMAENKPAFEVKLDKLKQWMVWCTHKDQGGIEVFIIFLDIVCIILCGLPLVHRVEVEAGVIILDGLEECSESILKAMTRLSGQKSWKCGNRAYHFGSICNGGDSLSLFFAVTSIGCRAWLDVGRCRG